MKTFREYVAEGLFDSKETKCQKLRDEKEKLGDEKKEIEKKEGRSSKAWDKAAAKYKKVAVKFADKCAGQRSNTPHVG